MFLNSIIPSIIIALILVAIFSALCGFYLGMCYMADSTPPCEDDADLPPPDEPIPFIISEFDSNRL